MNHICRVTHARPQRAEAGQINGGTGGTASRSSAARTLCRRLRRPGVAACPWHSADFSWARRRCASSDAASTRLRRWRSTRKIEGAAHRVNRSAAGSGQGVRFAGKTSGGEGLAERGAPLSRTTKLPSPGPSASPGSRAASSSEVWCSSRALRSHASAVEPSLPDNSRSIAERALAAADHSIARDHAASTPRARTRDQSRSTLTCS